MASGYQHLLFISYTRGPGHRTGPGSVQELVRKLRIELNDEIGRQARPDDATGTWCDLEPHSGTYFNDVLATELTRSALLLVLADNGYAKNAYCMWELDAFMRREAHLPPGCSPVLARSMIDPLHLIPPLAARDAPDWSAFRHGTKRAALRREAVGLLVQEALSRSRQPWIPDAGSLPLLAPPPVSSTVSTPGLWPFPTR